ncbi:MAG: hypothetical protein ACR2H1_08610 [Limisphaerales bacterium]
MKTILDFAFLDVLRAFNASTFCAEDSRLRRLSHINHSASPGNNDWISIVKPMTQARKATQRPAARRTKGRITKNEITAMTIRPQRTTGSNNCANKALWRKFHPRTTHALCAITTNTGTRSAYGKADGELALFSGESGVVPVMVYEIV